MDDALTSLEEGFSKADIEIVEDFRGTTSEGELLVEFGKLDELVKLDESTGLDGLDELDELDELDGLDELDELDKLDELGEVLAELGKVLEEAPDEVLDNDLVVDELEGYWS